MNALLRLLTCLTLISMTGCSSTKVISSEKADDVGSLDMKGKTVATLVIHPDERTRISAENAIAEELVKRGVNGVSSHTFLPTSELADHDKAKELIKGSGSDALVVVRVLDTEESARYRPATYEEDYYGSMMSYYAHGWSTVNTPGYMETIQTYTIETLCYRVADEKLVWKGISKSVNPASTETLAKELVKESAKVMKKQGLIVSRP